MRARKRFGQHFLERVWVDKVIAAIDPQPEQTFLEIGPGRGQLTEPLALRSGGVHAVEIDRDLVEELQQRHLPNVHVHSGDFLRLPASIWHHGGAPYRVAANLPYNVASLILIRLLAHARAGLVSDAVLMLQREVADRVLAAPGNGDYGPLAVVTALQADVSRLLLLPPGAFRPPPTVRSAVIRLVFRPDRVPVGDYPRFDQVVRHLFTMRRKMLSSGLHALAQGEGADATAWLHEAGIDGRRRAETLT
ncbi:MAG: 16S rRNA (adenine(1518)-N(6)/adenine(1519)-N(6))-dimethyltransferase RsmA, partial [Luteitalea sp.]